MQPMVLEADQQSLQKSCWDCCSMAMRQVYSALARLSEPATSPCVVGYEIPGEEQPRIYNCENLLSGTEMDGLIEAAYLQVFHEQQMLRSNRQRELESQLRSGQITVRDFIQGLVLSEPFRQRNYEVNNNYRFVQMCVQRLLGRNVYQEKEKLAWSIVLATSGLEGFVNALLDSDEYMTNFGYDTVPYQRRRILPQRDSGELPFARMPRYGDNHREVLEGMGYFRSDIRPLPLNQINQTLEPWDWQESDLAIPIRLIGAIIGTIGGLLLLTFILIICLGIWGFIPL